MLPHEQLQSYLVRAVTGFGERVQGAEVTDKELEQRTATMSTMAGELL